MGGIRRVETGCGTPVAPRLAVSFGLRDGSSLLDKRRGSQVVELNSNERFVSDDPGVVARLNGVDVAWSDVHARLVSTCIRPDMTTPR